MLGKISGPDPVKVPVEWRRLRKEELGSPHFSPIKMNGTGEARGKHGAEKHCIQDTGGGT